MIIFLYGQDSYRISKKLKEIIESYKAKNPSGLNFIKFDFAENSANDFYEAVKSNSIIPEKKLIIVKNIFRADSEALLKFLKSENLSEKNDIILIAISFSDTDKSKFFEYLTKKPNQAQNFKSLKDYEVKNWVKRFLDSFEIQFTGEALDFLVSNCGCDLWRLDSEIKKLASFKVEGIVSKSQIEELIVLDREHNIFAVTDALLMKNKKQALIALYKAMDNGEKPTELLGLLAWQVRNLLRFKTGAKPASLKLHPFVLGKLKESEKNFSIEKLNAFLSKIIDLDLAFKTTAINEKTALSLLISEL